jgi:hypothetical protein
VDDRRKRYNSSGNAQRAKGWAAMGLSIMGDWTCSIADFTGTMKGTMKGPGGKIIPPTKSIKHPEFLK